MLCYRCFLALDKLHTCGFHVTNVFKHSHYFRNFSNCGCFLKPTHTHNIDHMFSGFQVCQAFSHSAQHVIYVNHVSLCQRHVASTCMFYDCCFVLSYLFIMFHRLFMCVMCFMCFKLFSNFKLFTLSKLLLLCFVVFVVVVVVVVVVFARITV